MDTVGEGENGMKWEIRIDMYTLPCVKQKASGNLLKNHRELSSVFCDDLEKCNGQVGGREVQEGGDICIQIADIIGCTLETNTPL